MDNIFVHTHRRYTFTFSVKEKKRSSIKFYTQLYLIYKEVLRGSVIRFGVTELNSGTTQYCPCGLYTFTELKTITYLFTYLLTPWCRVLLEKLPGLQLVKKFPAFHETRRFITALTSLRHLSLSWASPIQSIYPHPTSWRSILILSTHLRLGLSSGLFPSGFPTKTVYTPSPYPYAPHAQPISFFSILSPAQYWARCKKL